MKKIFALTLLSAGLVFNAAAGDVAVFEDMGFSSDGKTYVFGQYGKTDVDFQSWAEIFVVDVEANNYVKNEVFRTVPSSATEKFSGKQTFEELKKKAKVKTDKYELKLCSVDELMYVRENEAKKGTEEISFRHFEGSTEDQQIFYTLNLVPTVTGSGLNVSSSYYIDLVKKDQDGKILDQKKVGTPSVKRKGITDYKIAKIYSNKKMDSLVMIIEKTLVDKTGTSIRYMVETVKF